MNFIIYIFFIKITLSYSYLTSAHFHTSIKLDNGNFIIFTCNNHYFILDQTFRNFSYPSVTVSGSDSYDIAKQFSKVDGGYIIYVTGNKHYILDSYGKYISSYSFSFNRDHNAYSVIPYNHIRDELYYYLIYITSPTIYFKEFSNNFTNNIFQEKKNNFYSFNKCIETLITCQLMKYSNEKVISCFFLTHLNYEYILNCTVFKSEEDFKIINTSHLKIEANSIYRLGSEVISNNERQKALIVLSIYHNNKYCLFYAGYDIQINNFTSYGYLIENNCALYAQYSYYFSISYFKETEEFIVSALHKCTFNNTYHYAYLIYSFDNNFKYSFFGKLDDLILGDTCCKSKAFIIIENSLHSIFFSSVAQKYCILLNLNTTNIISSFIINKEVHIVNPTELKSSDHPLEFLCEDYSNYNKTSCTNDSTLEQGLQRRLLEGNYIEKCTSEIDYITSKFTCNNYNHKTFNFSFNCSEKYPYEIVTTHKCVEYCDENELSNGTCILNYNNSNNIKITENIINTDSYEVINTQSDIISTEIEFKDIITNSQDTISETRNIESDNSISSETNLITNSKDTILETGNKETDSSISSETNLITNSKDTILETGNIESDSSIISETNLITNSKDTILETGNIESDSNINSVNNFITNSKDLLDSQTINKLTTTNILEYTTISSSEPKILELLDDILNNKLDNNTNFIENINNIFSDASVNSILDKIINENKDITISNNEKTVQITSTDNQRNNKNHNISTINLGECENTLKSIYNIDTNKSLLILKIDSHIVGSNIPVIQYEVYHPDNKSKLDLSFCNNKVEINIPVKIDENNLYKYEPDSDYYNDRCYGNDKPIEYRRKEFINNNMSLCESDCDYMGYDSETKNSKCECELKKEISIFNIKIDTERLYNQFTGLTSSNLDIIKCYYLLFQKVNLMYNIGFYVILFIIIIFCIGAIIFIFKGYNLLVKKIDIIIKTNHLLNTRNLKSKNNMIKRRKSIKKKKNTKKTKNKNKSKNNNKSKKKDNPPIKRVKNKNRNKNIKEGNNRYDLSNEAKSIQKLNSKNNESLVNNINNEKGKIKTNVKNRKRKSKLNTINKSKLVTDVPFSKNNSLNKAKIFLSDYELNRLQYKEAIKYDKRTYVQYYWSLLKIGNLFLFSFIPNDDYNSMVIKICLFFFSFGLYYTVNALFFTDSTMNKIYEDNGEYDFIYQIPKLLYSNLICTVINLIVKVLSLSEKDILSIKILRKEENLDKKVKSIKNCLKIKFFFYYLVSFLFLFIFLFYTSCFCAVYRNTQLYLIKDTLISFSLSLLYPLGYYLVPGIFRLPALKNMNRNCIYKISLLLQSL